MNVSDTHDVLSFIVKETSILTEYCKISKGEIFTRRITSYKGIQIVSSSRTLEFESSPYGKKYSRTVYIMDSTLFTLIDSKRIIILKLIP